MCCLWALQGHEDGLQFFLLTSSVSALVGSPGQANYAAANAALDAFAAYRLTQGRVCRSLQFGAWQESGMATRSAQTLVGAAHLPRDAAGRHRCRRMACLHCAALQEP